VLGKALQIAQTLPVVYVAAEGSHGLHARVSAWCQHYRLSPGDLHFLCNEVNLRDETAVRTLAQATAKIKPGFIVIDTLARCMLGGDENSAKDVGMAIHGCFLLQQAFSASVCIVHHNNRADRGERGSGALRGAADTMIEVVTGGDGLIRISCSKTKDTEPWETEDLVFRPVADSGVLISASNLETIAINLTPIEKQIMEFLALSVFETAGAQIEQVVKALNISERHVYRLLSGLKNKGLARNVSKRLPMLLTDIGRDLLSTFADKSLPIAQTTADIEVE
jgi:predicted transcriptional regulator